MNYASTQRQIAALVSAYNRLQHPLSPSSVNPERYVIDFDGETVAGCCEIQERAWYMAELGHFVVAPEYRRNPFRFIRLLKRAVKEAHKSYPVLVATVRADNGPMIRGIFKLALGFKVQGKFLSRISKKPVYFLSRMQECK